MKVFRKASAALTAFAMIFSVSASSFSDSALSFRTAFVSAEEASEEDYVLSISRENYEPGTLSTFGEWTRCEDTRTPPDDCKNVYQADVVSPKITEDCMDNKVATVKLRIDRNLGIYAGQFVLKPDPELIFAGCVLREDGRVSDFESVKNTQIKVSAKSTKMILTYEAQKDVTETGDFLTLLFILPDDIEEGRQYKVEINNEITKNQITAWNPPSDPVTYNGDNYGYIQVGGSVPAVTTLEPTITIPELTTTTTPTTTITTPETTTTTTTVTTPTTTITTPETTTTTTTVTTPTTTITTPETTTTTTTVTTPATTITTPEATTTTTTVTTPVTTITTPEVTTTTTTVTTPVTTITTPEATTTTTTVTTPATTITTPEVTTTTTTVTTPVTTITTPEATTTTTTVTTPAITKPDKPLIDIILDSDKGDIKSEQFDPDMIELGDNASIDIEVPEKMIYQGTENVEISVKLSDFDSSTEYFEYAGFAFRLPEGFTVDASTLKTDLNGNIEFLEPGSSVGNLLESNGGYVVFKGVDTRNLDKDAELFTVNLKVSTSVTAYLNKIEVISLFGRLTDKTVINEDGTITPYVSIINNRSGGKVYKETDSVILTGIKGDVNLDHKIMPIDATLIGREVLSISTQNGKSILADVINTEETGEYAVALSKFLGDVDESANGTSLAPIDATKLQRAILLAQVNGSKEITNDIWKEILGK